MSIRSSNPLKSGYSKKTIQANISKMIREGYARERAVAAAHRSARDAYWKQFPKGYLPKWIYPERNGTRMQNPTVTHGADRLNYLKRSLSQGAKLYEDFTGHEAEVIGKVKKPAIPDVAVQIGYCTAICYETIRDGKTQHYIHEFKKSAQPIFAVTPKGEQIFLLGGNYDFTERGIVDGR